MADGLCPGVARAVVFIPLCQGTSCWGGWGPCRSFLRSHVSFTEGAQPCTEQLQGTSATSSV